MIFSTSILVAPAFAQDTPPLPIQELLEKEDVVKEISGPYIWNEDEYNAYSSILQAPRFNPELAQQTFEMTNIDQLRLLKDMLDVLPSTRVLTTGGKLYKDLPPVGINPCLRLSPPFNPQSNFNDVHVEYILPPFNTPATSPPTPVQAALDVVLTNQCPVSSKTAFHVGIDEMVGFGTNMPESKYHFVSTNFQVGNNTGLNFKITPNSILYSNGGNQLVKIADDGTIYAHKVRVTLANPFPDYVFEKDYNLMPLSQLSEYIQTNKHLPNIPSAKEVEAEKNLDVAEMQLKMMEKIEELTLYILQQQKEIEALKLNAAK